MTSSSRPRNVPLPAGARSPVHARYIPREDLNSFTPWNPDALAGGTTPTAPLRRATDRPLAGQDAAAAPEELAGLLRAARRSGYQDGHRDGLVALGAFQRAYANQVTAQLGVLTAAYHDELDAMQRQLALAVAATAEHVARQVVRSELAARPELVAVVAQEAIETLLLSARYITLRVHPDDHALVAHGTAEVLALRGARLVADASLARGGCRVESDIGAIDGSLQTRWSRAVAALGRESAWEPETASRNLPPSDAESGA